MYIYIHGSYLQSPSRFLTYPHTPSPWELSWHSRRFFLVSQVIGDPPWLMVGLQWTIPGKHGWFGGTPISGNFHISSYIYQKSVTFNALRYLLCTWLHLDVRTMTMPAYIYDLSSYVFYSYIHVQLCISVFLYDSVCTLYTWQMHRIFTFTSSFRPYWLHSHTLSARYRNENMVLEAHRVWINRSNKRV